MQSTQQALRIDGLDGWQPSSLDSSLEACDLKEVSDAVDFTLLGPTDPALEVASFAEEAVLQQHFQADMGQQSWLGALVQSSPDLIGTASLSGQWLFLNRAGQHWLGSDALPTLSDSLLSIDQDYFCTEVIPTLLQRGHWRGQLRFQNVQTGAIVTADCQWFVMRNPQTDQPLCLATLSRKVSVEVVPRVAQGATLEKPHEQQHIHEQQPMLNSEDARVLGDVAHELRTPLGVIASSAGLLQAMHPDAAKTQKHCQRILHKVEQMARLIEDLLLVSRTEQGSFPLPLAEVDVKAICTDLIEEAHQNSARHNILFSHSGHSSPAAFVVQGDETLVQRMISNLLSNSLKYSPDGGRVDVRLHRGETALTIQIQDEGIGIPVADQPHLFDSFYRAGNTGKIAGTGLGLAIVKRCVDLHGGAISVDSQVARGTTFTITLPTCP